MNVQMQTQGMEIKHRIRRRQHGTEYGVGNRGIWSKVTWDLCRGVWAHGFSTEIIVGFQIHQRLGIERREIGVGNGAVNCTQSFGVGNETNGLVDCGIGRRGVPEERRCDQLFFKSGGGGGGGGQRGCLLNCVVRIGLLFTVHNWVI